MKKIIFYLLISLWITSVSANELHHAKLATLHDHMVTVNKEWKVQSDLPDQLLQMPMQFESDHERIQTHLKLVALILSTRDYEYSNEVLAKRNKNLESLVSYWNNGVFPINTKHNKRQPYFIDDFGTACAVGHLLQTSGEKALAQQISNESNYAYIHELVYPQLGKWATLNGFTQGELAWIQPGYQTSNCVDYAIPEGNWSDNSSTAEIHVLEQSPSGIIIAGNFSINAIGGTANSIAIYDGADYTSIPIPIVGTVYDVAVEGNDIYIVGDFTVSGTNYENVIKTDLTNWTGLQSGNMNGAVKKVEVYDCNVFVSGDFTTVNGQSQAHIAAFSILLNDWTNQPLSCASIPYSALLYVTGPVNDILLIDNKIAVGGSFYQVGIINPVSVADGLAFYNRNGWTPAVSSNNTVNSVDHLIDFNGDLIVGANALYHYDYQAWNAANTLSFPGDFCANFSEAGPFDALYTIGEAPNHALVAGKGTSTEMLNWNLTIYGGTKVDVSLNIGALNTGIYYENKLYYGGSFSGTSIYSEEGCGVSYYCNSPWNLGNSGKLMTFEVPVMLPLRVMLEGPFDQSTSLMNDQLRLFGHLPTAHPFSGAPWNYTGGEMANSGVFSISGNNAITDWVLIELRDTGNPSTVVVQQAALLQRNGSVVAMDGVSDLEFNTISPGDYFVVIHHRNHLPAMSQQPVSLGRNTPIVDFTSLPMYGTNAVKVIGSNQLLWTGDVDTDQVISAADRSVTWNNRNNSGYLLMDTNLDGNCNALDRSQVWNNRNLVGQLP